MIYICRKESPFDENPYYIIVNDDRMKFCDDMNYYFYSKEDLFNNIDENFKFRHTTIIFSNEIIEKYESIEDMKLKNAEYFI